MVPHRVILAESSSPRPVLEWKSSRPRRVLKNRLKIRVAIYLFLSVGRKMTPFPETVSDPTSCRVESSSSSHRLVESSSSSQLHRVILVESSSSSQPCLSESSSCSYGASSSHPRRVIESSPSPGEKIETSSSSVEVPLEISSVYLFIFERR